MKKSDIKNGMHLITNSGDEYVVMSDVFAYSQTSRKAILINLTSRGWMSLDDNYDNDLHCHDDDGMDCQCFDIKEVYAPKFYTNVFDAIKNNEGIFVKLWERTVKMTKEEIEKELGYKIEIVD